MKKLKILTILITILFVFFTFNLKCYAGYDFLETEYEENALLNVFSNIFCLAIILLYIFIQIILMFKDKKNKKFKNNFKAYLITNTIISIIVILLFCIINNITELIFSFDIFIDSNNIINIINIVINILILIFGIFFGRKLLKNNTENDKLFHNKNNLIKIILLVVILVCVYIFIKITPQAHIIRREWSFGKTLNIIDYNIKLSKGKTFYILNTDISQSPLLVKDIDDEGILLEYERKYYERKSDSIKSNSNENFNNTPIDIGYFFGNNWDLKTEVVQQKIKWNVYYSYEISKDPTMDADGGYEYYVKFTK